MASVKAKFIVFQELFAKNHRGPLPPSGARVNVNSKTHHKFVAGWFQRCFIKLVLWKCFWHSKNAPACLEDSRALSKPKLSAPGSFP